MMVVYIRDMFLSQTMSIIISLIHQLMVNYMDIHLQKLIIQVNLLEVAEEQFK